MMAWFRPVCAALAVGASLGAPFAVADESAASTDAEIKAAAAAFRQSVQPLFAEHCQACHSGDEPMGELDFDGYFERLDVEQDREVWEKIARKLHNQEMPPEGEPQPDETTRATMTTWIDAQLARFGCDGQHDPGRVTIRRLNRNEYDNTIRDLLGVDFHPADDFPSDDVGYGFDNIGDVLSLPPILLEKYLTAAQRISARALGTEQVNLVTGEITGGQLLEGGQRVLSHRLEVRSKVRMFGTGDYMIRVRAYGQQAGDEPVKMSVYLDKTLVRRFDVHATESDPQLYEAWLNSRGGRHAVSIVFENDYYEPDEPEPNDRNLYVRDIELMGPYPASFQTIVSREHTPEDKLLLAREVISNLVRRAFRRPPAPGEVDRLVELFRLAEAEGENFNAAIGLALEAILVSPHFLFRVELDPPTAEPGSIRPLNDFELATRLSYFLWSSMPDDELLLLAELGLLKEGDQLDRQVARMLADPKSAALVENFAGQWLQLRNLDIVSPDKGRFPDFDESLRTAMRRETELFFAAVVREDRSVLDFLDGEFSYVNERLARHYGLEDVEGEDFRRVLLDPQQRGGVLTQASVLTVTSNPTRTSPVKRGKWVLENILGTPPPPPPPDVPELQEGAEGELTGSLRERMEQHRANAVCASCHNRMDPLGFGLENYDAVGAWRTQDGPHEVDASGTLPNGQSFAGPRELKTILKARQDDFLRCLSEKMLTFALGRGLEYSDRCALEKIVEQLKTHDYRFSTLIAAVVHSDPFQMQRARGSEP